MTFTLQLYCALQHCTVHCNTVQSCISFSQLTLMLHCKVHVCMFKLVLQSQCNALILLPTEAGLECEFCYQCNQCHECHQFSMSSMFNWCKTFGMYEHICFFRVTQFYFKVLIRFCTVLRIKRFTCVVKIISNNHNTQKAGIKIAEIIEKQGN